MRTVYGVCLDRLGHAATNVLEQGRDRPELRFKAWATPSDLLLRVQNPTLPVDWCHDGVERGQVIHLERRSNGDIVAVAEVDDSVRPEVHVRVANKNVAVPQDLFWSVERVGGPDYGIALTSLALTPATARIGARPVVFRDGNAHMAAYTSHDPYERGLLHRASEAHLKRHGGPIVLDDETRDTSSQAIDPTPTIEYRSSTPVDASTSRRTIDLIVMPYETPTRVAHKGRMVTEIISSSAFDTIPRDGGRVRVNRDHSRERTVGRAISFNPSHPNGLYATLHISDTELGRETLELAQDGVLDASAGFAVQPGGEHWENNRSRRRITRAYLDHIALTPDPAYETANVLAVRGHLT